MKEIERKFLVKSSFDQSLFASGARLTQGYLSSVKERTVRVRIKGEKGYLTIKGLAYHSGTTRFEFEKEIDLHEAKELLKLCEPGIIDKIRVEIPFENHLFEVDLFQGKNEGLILAEIELNSPDESFKHPPWLGEEVTMNPQYYNSNLAKKPFSTW